MPLAQGQVGVQVNNDGNNPTNLRMTKLAALVVQELHGRYYEQAYRRNIYSAAALGQTTSVGAATTVVGLTLSNPIGSPVNLVLNKVGYSFIVAFAAGSVVGLQAGYSGSTGVTHTTPVTPRSTLISTASAGIGLADSTCTVPVAPTLQLIFDSGLTGAITTAPSGVQGLIDVEGSIIIAPGGYVSTYTSTASGAAGASFSFQWEETPV